MSTLLTRRQALGSLAALALPAAAEEPRGGYRLATFSAEVTPPIGHPCMGGGIDPVRAIDDPLFAHGIVLFGVGEPVVLAAIDWCEIRNDAYTRWREALAKAAGTTPGRVLFASVHQHDAPIADLEAQRLLEKHKAKGQICDLEFHEKAVTGVARAVTEAVKKPRRVTHVGTGQAKVEKVASNRRYLDDEGRPHFGRTSATRDPKVRARPEGTIDPYLKTLSFWDGDRAVAALSCYATHPMSHYGKGRVSSDFVGLARRRRQADDAGIFQVYFSGCSGNVTAGKYNDGSPANRGVLADRMYRGLVAAWKETKRVPLGEVRFRSVPLELKPRSDKGFTVADLTRRLKEDPRPFGQCLAALGLSWRRRADAGHKLDVPALDLGAAQFLLLPAEAYVEYQLGAQKARPGSFVMTAGYGECAPGYIPTEKHFREKDTNLREWCWVAPGCEKAMRQAVRKVLKAEG
jgi:hypothetical protein